MFDLIVLVLLIIAVATGLWTLHRHSHKFIAFRTHDIVAGRLDARLYVITTASTSVSLIDAFLCLYWLFNGGWDAVGLHWHWMWLTLHTGYALTIIGIHRLFNRLLSNTDFCALCRRKW